MIIIPILSFAALRAMTGHKGESAVMLFLFFSNFLKLCGAIHNFDCSMILSPPLPLKGFMLNIDYQYDKKHSFKIFVQLGVITVRNNHFISKSRKPFQILLWSLPCKGKTWLTLGKRSRTKTPEQRKRSLDRATQGKETAPKPSGLETSEKSQCNPGRGWQLS